MSDVIDRFTARFHPGRVAPGTFADDNDILLFVHVPKTAGVAVSASLKKAVDTFRPVDWRRTQPSFVTQTQQALYQRTQRPGRQVIMGHFGAKQLLHWHNYNLPVKAAAILRDPVSRAVSSYNYNRSDRHPDAAAFRSRYASLEEFVSDMAPDYQLNYMLGAFYSFEDALERLIADFSFLGVISHLDAALAHLSRSHGLPELRARRKNRAPRFGGGAEADETVRAIVAEKSANDQKLIALLESFYA